MGNETSASCLLLHDYDTNRFFEQRPTDMVFIQGEEGKEREGVVLGIPKFFRHCQRTGQSAEYSGYY